MAKTRQAKCRDVLHLSREECAEVLSQLEQSVKRLPARDNRRAGERFPLPEGHVFVFVFGQGSAEPTYFQTRCRNISAGGAAFLHRWYVHPGTTCRLIVVTPAGVGIRFEATVVRCRYVTREVCEVAVRFATPVDIEELLPEVAAPCDPDERGDAA